MQRSLTTQKQIDAQRQSKLLIVAESIATFSVSRPKILIMIVALLSSRLTRYTTSSSANKSSVSPHPTKIYSCVSEAILFLGYPPEVRRLIYTTNAIEALNSKIHCAVRTRGHFPSDEAASKLIYLTINATSTEWKRTIREWHKVRSQLAIMFEDSFPMA
jgi:putative transposase